GGSSRPPHRAQWSRPSEGCMPRGPSARGRCVDPAAEGGDALLANLPHVVEAAPVHRLRAGDPVAEKSAVKVVLVRANLIDGDGLLMQEALDGRRARGDP